MVDRRYRVVMRLGSGGMGVVYQVEHLHLGKKAAMKVLTPDGAAQPEMVRRFRNEAQAVSKLDHPNIVQTFDFGQCDGALYLVMEYVNGEDLSALIRREGPWSFARAARLFAQVCAGLVEAHEAGIVHRDLKPENLMVVKRRDGSEHVKILDFGLAKLRERATDSERSSVSSGGQVIGTPYYMAPEQVRGEPLDARADLYSVGATLYRVLTGVPPFDAPSPMSVLAKHLTDELVPPCARAPERALPPEADRIVLRAMEKAASDRYASALEMRDDLERALSELGAGARASFSSSSSSSLSPPPSPAELDPVPVSRADALTVPIDDSDIVGYGDRLRRSDVDDYEWGLRRRRLMTRLLLPLAAVAALGGGVALWARFGGERAELVEREPNNTPGYANLLPMGAPLRGTIGKLNADGHGDVDYFRVPAGKGVRAVDARLEGIPNVDLVLEIYDAEGRRVAKSDEHGRGWGEWLQPTTIGPGEAYLAVREVWIQGTKPTEEVADPYTLTVRWGPPQGGVGDRAQRLAGRGDAAAGAGAPAWLSGTRRRSGLVRDHRRPRRHVDRIGQRAVGRRPRVDERARREAADRQARRRRDRRVRRRGACRDAGADRDRPQAPTGRRREGAAAAGPRRSLRAEGRAEGRPPVSEELVRSGRRSSRRPVRAGGCGRWRSRVGCRPR